MSLSARKKVAEHQHTTDEVKQARKYVCNRPKSLGIPASEIVMNATEDATTYLSNMTWAQSYEISTDGTNFIGKNKTGVVVSTDPDANVVFQDIVDIAPEGTLINIRDGTFPELHVVVTDKRLKFQGDGIGGTFLKPKSGYYALTFEGSAVGVNYAYTGYVNDLTITGAGIANAYGLKLRRIGYAMVKNVVIRVDKNAFLNEMGYNNRYTDCVSEGTNGYAFFFQGSGAELCEDQWLTNCLAEDSAYGFFFGDGANGFQLNSCGAYGCSVACFNLEGVWSGGWANNCWADNSSGDGWIIKASATHISSALQLSNIWGTACARGLVVTGASASRYVDALQISGSFNSNKRCGIKLEGYISNSKFNVIANNNNTDNVLTDEATNLLIYQGCQQVTFSSSQFNALQGASRKETVRLVMDSNAGRNQITNFYNCILGDAIPAKAKFGIKNIHASYALQLYIGGNRGIDNALQDQYIIDAASTGTINVYNLASYLSSGSTFPTAPFIGQYFYREDLNVLYRYTGTAWNPVHNTTGEGTTFPTSKQVGDIFFRTDEGKLYKWNGILWMEYLLLTSTGGNLVSNSDFEVPSLSQQVNPYGWTTAVWAGAPTFGRTTSDPVSGACCISTRNNPPSDYGSWYGDYFPVLPSRPYLFSGYCMTSHSGRKAEIGIVWCNKNKTVISSQYLETNSLSWTRLSKVITAPANATYGLIELRGYASSGSTVTYSYDNIKFVELSVSGSTFPTNPIVGDIFYHETYTQSFRYDPDSPSPKVSGWVPLTRVTHSGTTAERAAASVVTGDFWFDTDQNSMYRWTGTEWFFMGTALATVQGTEPSENLLRNAEFEIDLNADGVPDNWAYYADVGAGSIAVYATDQMKGKQSCKVSANVASRTYALSDFIPFDPTKPVYVECYSKPSVNNINVKVELFLYGYDKNKGFIGAKYTSNGSRSPSVWTKDSFSTTPATDTDYGANRANIRYLRVGLFCNGSAYGSTSYVLFDGVILSGQKGLESTAGTVGGIQAGASVPEKTIGTSWVDIANFIVSENVECYFVRVIFHRIYQTDTVDHDDNLYVELVIDGVEYPSSTGSLSEFILPASGVQTGFPVTFMITVPKNINGKTIYIKAKSPRQTIYSLVAYEGWGHSPHTHR